jgi:hypothetical protein
MRGIVPKVILSALATILILAALYNCNRAESGKKETGFSVPAMPVKDYVGREQCRECHQKEYSLFLGSDTTWPWIQQMRKMVIF